MFSFKIHETWILGKAAQMEQFFKILQTTAMLVARLQVAIKPECL